MLAALTPPGADIVLASFAARARDLEIEFFDREGEPTWIGLHLDTNPNWERVIFGTQIVYPHPEDIARMDGPPPDPADFLPADPEGSISLLSLVEQTPKPATGWSRTTSGSGFAQKAG